MGDTAGDRKQADVGETAGFAHRVAVAVATTGPLCAGIDPSATLLADWGLSDSADGLRNFGERCVEAFAGVVPVVKPQVAFFERHGAAGMSALESTIAAATSAGLIVIADAKRGDIGSTTEAYASAWLDPRSPLCVDAMTASPYLGLAALAPLISVAGAGGRGVIVVVRSSNPEGRALQQALTGAGKGPAVEDRLLANIAERNRTGSHPGTVGAVVGATLAPSRFDLAGLGGTILAPGVGTQGATASDVGELFDGCRPGQVLASASRSVLEHGPDPDGLAEAARRVRDEVAVALG